MFLLISLLPVAMAGAYLAVAFALRDRLPDPLAIHFGFSGQADGFMSFSSSVTINAILIAIPALLGVFLSRKIVGNKLAAVFGWLTSLMAGSFLAISLWILLLQLDLTLANQATLNANWFLVFLFPTLLILLALLTPPRVIVSDSAVEIRSLKIPLLKLKLSEIVSVGVEKVLPMDFGGWGLRLNASGDLAFISSAGEAVSLQLERRKILIRTNQAEKIRQNIERKIS